MQTSCPECGTTFRVSQDQLGLRRGLVRCGTCNAVFNAYDTLLPELEGAPAVLPGAEDKPVPELGTEQTAAQDALPSTVKADAQTSSADQSEPTLETDVWAEVQAELDMPSDLPDVPPRDALAAYLETASARLPPDAEDEIELSETSGFPREQMSSGYQPEAETPEAILLSDLPNRQEDRNRLPRWKTSLYVLAILLLTVSLTGQVAYFLRGELAAAIPATRPALDALCQPLNCVVPMPKQLTRQAIVSSSLEHDTEQKSRVRLTFLLANRTNQTQTWPHILLTLSDVRESPVAQKAFSPEDYLPKGVSARAGFLPQSEQEVRIELDIGNLAAASYLLNIAYP